MDFLAPRDICWALGGEGVGSRPSLLGSPAVEHSIEQSIAIEYCYRVEHSQLEGVKPALVFQERLLEPALEQVSRDP